MGATKLLPVDPASFIKHTQIPIIFYHLTVWHTSNCQKVLVYKRL